MRQHLPRAVMGMLLVALVLAVLPGSRATAASWTSHCAAGGFCLYDQDGGQGAELANDPRVPVQGVDPAWNDRARSVDNRSPYWACLYADAGYGGTVQAVRPGGQATLAELGTHLDGKVTSFKGAKSKAGCFTGYERCETGRLCLFAEESGRGAMTSFTEDEVRDYGAGWNDRTVSVFNHTAKHACFYPENGLTGSWSANGSTYRAFVVLSGDSTFVPAPYAGTLSSDRLVTAAGGRPATDFC
ncbi:peptidase inhibitor family I36 protein [Kitasatospora sp. NPDC096140]|uniref:peptidase inhibitor family I36 protein n=1 Tax=Kitasatospora sp. NPDC096140 TaxID=3155425 RepID=UPI00332EAA01